MKEENKINTISNLFDGFEIRSIWDKDKEEYYFSVVDVIGALTDSDRPRKYWNDLKIKLKSEGSQLSEKIGQQKMKSSKDGKMYMTDTLDTEGILRLIESVPSPKAEPFKMWLASLGKERIDEVFDPEIAMNRAIDYYRKKGYNDDWIKKRFNGILSRKQLTDIWKYNGVNKPVEFAILTNEMYKAWSDMTAKEYKEFKGIRKESLRDNMSDIELLLTDLSEITAREIAKQEHPRNLKENLLIAKRGNKTAKITKDYFEKETKVSAVTSDNNIGMRYIDENKSIENR